MNRETIISGMWYLKAKLTLAETFELAHTLSHSDARYATVAVRPVAQNRFGIYFEFVPPKNADLAAYLQSYTQSTEQQLSDMGFPTSGHDIGTPVYWVKLRKGTK